MPCTCSHHSTVYALERRLAELEETNTFLRAENSAYEAAHVADRAEVRNLEAAHQMVTEGRTKWAILADQQSRRLDDAESAMRRTLELCQHWWAGGEMDPIKSYFATYQSVVDDDPDSSADTKATD